MAEKKITSRKNKITSRRNKNTMKRKTYRKKRKTIKRINKRIYKKQQEGGDVVTMLLSTLVGAAAQELASRPILRDKHQCKWGEGRRFGRCKNRNLRSSTLPSWSRQNYLPASPQGADQRGQDQHRTDA